MHNFRLHGVKILLILTLFLSACTSATPVPNTAAAPVSTESATSLPAATDTSAVSSTAEVTGTVGSATPAATDTLVATETTQATSAVETAAVEMTGTVATASTPEVTSTALVSGTPGAMPGDIVGVVMSSTEFSTLVKALNAAGLVDQLKQAGPFTVFVPNDQAFSKLSGTDLSALLSDPQRLKNVLTYHVVSGRYTAADLAKTTSLTTLNGAPLTVTVQSGVVYVNGAQVVQSDIQAANGVVHVIDTVLMPPTQ